MISSYYLVKLNLADGDVIYMKYLFPPPVMPNSQQVYLFYGVTGGNAIVGHKYCASSAQSCDVGLIQFNENTFDLVYANYFAHPSGDNGDYYNALLYDSTNNNMNYIRNEINDILLGQV